MTYTEYYYALLAHTSKDEADATLVCDEDLTTCVNGEWACPTDASVPDIVAWWSDGEDSRYEV